MIYLDNASTTRIAPEVLETMLPYLTEQFGNPGTLYELGRTARNAIEKSREQVAGFIRAVPEQIIFTSGGTEANNLAICGSVKPYGAVVAASTVEHDSVLRAIERHCDGLVSIEVDQSGVVHPETVEKILTSYAGRIGLVSVMHINNETGAVNDVKRIADICKQHGVLFHTDCVQSAGFLPLNVGEIGCDFLSISSHKIHGAKGVGALYVRDKSLLAPLICGGVGQEFGLRGGTENVAGIVGFGKACEIAARNLQDAARAASPSTVFYRTLITALDKRGFSDIIRVNGECPYSGNRKVLNLLVDGVDAETLVLLMGANDVYISAGSACRSRSAEPSRVLMAMGRTPEQARSSVRVSFSVHNTIEETEKAACIMADCIEVLKAEVHLN